MPDKTNNQNRKIILGKEESLMVRILSPEELSKMKNEKAISQINTIPINGATRTFETDGKQIVVEFFNGSAVMIHSKEGTGKLRKVTFLRLLYSGKRNEISYMVNSDEPSFNLLKESAIRFDPGEYLAFFGEEFYRMDSGEVLVKWSPKFSPGKYAILEHIRTMIGIDFELADFIGEEKPDLVGLNIQDAGTKEGAGDLSFKIENGQQTNLEKMKAGISAALNIDSDSLDFSMESIDKIETSLFWNSDNLDPRELLIPCAAYLGEFLARKFNLEWEIQEGYYEYGRLKSKTGRRIDIVEKLADSMIDTDYGISEVRWVVGEIMDILNREKDRGEQ